MRKLKRMRAKYVIRLRGITGAFKHSKGNNRYGTKKKTRGRRCGNSPSSYFAQHWREFVEPVFIKGA